MKNKIKVNLNNNIYVKLTEEGHRIIKEKDEKSFPGHLAQYREEIKVDEEGYTAFQIWRFMAYFGKYAYCGNPKMPYETNVLIEEGDII